MANLLPIHVNLDQQPVLLIGGGEVAYRKARLLADAGACITVVAEWVSPQVADLVATTNGAVISQTYSTECIKPFYKLIVAATDNADVNIQVYHHAEAQNILVNVVDDLPHCRFVVPAIVSRSPVTVSIGTQGTSPVLARKLRTQIEMLLPSNIGITAEFAGRMRPELKTLLPTLDERRRFWEWALSTSEVELAAKQPAVQWPQALASLVHAYHKQKTTGSYGEVYLVGAGPGDPDLLTLKALRLMQQAEVIVYDRLVSKPILDMCRKDADYIYVGKARSNHTLPQPEINQLLVKLALEGKRVCRLKGGDPFIFGRGGEELADIISQNIPFTVVPGVTAAAGCAAYAGIPLTHRDYAQSVRLLTGHLKDGSPELAWAELVHPQQTLVLYMGLVGLENISQQLIAHGMPANMPVALVSKGTTPEQQVIIGQIATIAEQVKAAKLPAPTIIIIGEVVKLAAMPSLG